MRRSEAVNLQWREVDFVGRCIRLKASKTGTSVRPIGSVVTGMLADIKDRQYPGVCVFPAKRIERAAFGGIPRAWRRIISTSELDDNELNELENFTLHGLRHGFATTANTLGLTLPTVAALLGHAAGGVTAGYIGRIDTVLAAAADRVANQIARQMGDQKSGEIVSIPSMTVSK